MNTERPIREWYDLLPEPERTEAIEACDADVPYSGDIKVNSLPMALHGGFVWAKTKQGHDYWAEVFNSEVDRLRARIAELEGALRMIEEGAPCDSDFELGGKYDYEHTGNSDDLCDKASAQTHLWAAKIARTILNKK